MTTPLISDPIATAILNSLRRTDARLTQALRSSSQDEDPLRTTARIREALIEVSSLIHLVEHASKEFLP